MWGHLDRPPPPYPSQGDVSSDAVDDDVANILFAADSEEGSFVERPPPLPDPDPPDPDPIQAESMAESAEIPYESQWLPLLDPDNDLAQTAFMQSGDASPLHGPTTTLEMESSSASNEMAESQSNHYDSTSHAGRLVQFSTLTYAGDPDLAILSARQALTGEERGGGGGEGLPTNSDSELRYAS